MFSRSDESLFRALLDGDLTAFDALYDRYERPLYGFIRRQLADDAEAEDVLHETFLALLRDSASARNARSFRAWVFTVARNLCLNRVRTTRRAAAASRNAPVDDVPGPQLSLEAAQQQLALSKAVAALPDAHAELFHLRSSGLSYDALAELLDIPIGTVKSRLHELVRRLREELS